VGQGTVPIVISFGLDRGRRYDDRQMLVSPNPTPKVVLLPALCEEEIVG
jgi:hypothetical protein